MEIEAAQTGEGVEEGMVGGKVALVGGGVGRSPLRLPSRAVEKGGAGDRFDVDESGLRHAQEGGGGARVMEGGSRGHMSVHSFGERAMYHAG
jgi:hypothetical protein